MYFRTIGCPTFVFFFFSSRRRHTRLVGDWSSDVCFRSPQRASEVAGGSRASAERGGEVVAAAIASMQQITSASRRIADIISIVDAIAFQTNLLALNAAVEAMRESKRLRQAE